MTKEELKAVKKKVKESLTLSTLCEIGIYSTYWGNEEEDNRFLGIARDCKEALEKELGYMVALTQHKVFIIADKELLPIYSS